MLTKDSKNMENVGYYYQKTRMIEKKVENNIQEILNILSIMNSINQKKSCGLHYFFASLRRETEKFRARFYDFVSLSKVHIILK